MVPTCPGKEEPVYPHTFNKQLRCNIIISLPAFLPSCSVCCLFFLPSRYNPGAPGSYQAGLSDYTWGLKRKKADKSKLTPINHIAFTKVLRQWEVCLDPTVTHFLAGRGQWWGEISEGLEDGEKRDPGFLAHEASDYEKKHQTNSNERAAYKDPWPELFQVVKVNQMRDIWETITARRNWRLRADQLQRSILHETLEKKKDMGGGGDWGSSNRPWVSVSNNMGLAQKFIWVFLKIWRKIQMKFLANAIYRCRLVHCDKRARGMFVVGETGRRVRENSNILTFLYIENDSKIIY